MQAIIDVIGALAIGGLILITMLTTLFNVQFSSQDIARSVLLYDNVQKSCERVHSALATIALDMPMDSVFIRTDESRFTFYSKWDIQNDVLSDNAIIYDMYMETLDSEFGSALRFEQNGSETLFFDFIMWIDDIRFTYLDINDIETANPMLIRTIQVEIDYRRAASAMDRSDLITNITLWSFIKNLSFK